MTSLADVQQQQPLSALAARLLSGWSAPPGGAATRCIDCGAPVLHPPREGAVLAPAICLAECSAAPHPSRRRADPALPSPPPPRTPGRRLGGGEDEEAAMTTDRPAPPDGSGDATPLRPPLPAPLPPPPDAPVGPGGDVSASLGDLLLRGWAMLGDACPRCEATPLMREPAGAAGQHHRRMYCVRCRAWAASAPAAAAAAAGAAPAPPPPPAVAAPTPPPPPPPPPPPRHQASRPTTAASPPASSSRPPTYQPATAAALADAEAALAAAVEAATAALVGLDVAADPGRASDLARLLGDAAGALNRVCAGRGAV